MGYVNWGSKHQDWAVNKAGKGLPRDTDSNVNSRHCQQSGQGSASRAACQRWLMAAWSRLE